MADKLSETIFADHQKSIEQFDYFILGLAGATIAYLAQNLVVSTFSSLSYDLQLLSITMLFGSVYCGVMRIQNGVYLKQLNHSAVSWRESNERRRELLEAKPEAEKYYDPATNGYYNKLEMELLIQRNVEGIDDILTNQKDPVIAKGLKYYNARNWLFFAGFVGIFLAKVLSPYIH